MLAHLFLSLLLREDKGELKEALSFGEERGQAGRRRKRRGQRSRWWNRRKHDEADWWRQNPHEQLTSKLLTSKRMKVEMISSDLALCGLEFSCSRSPRQQLGVCKPCIRAIHVRVDLRNETADLKTCACSRAEGVEWTQDGPVTESPQARTCLKMNPRPNCDLENIRCCQNIVLADLNARNFTMDKDLQRGQARRDDRPDGEEIMDPAPDSIRASLSRDIKASSFSLSSENSDKGCLEAGYAAAGDGATGEEYAAEGGDAEEGYAAGGGATEYAPESGPRRAPPPPAGTSPWPPMRKGKSTMHFGWEAGVSLSDLSI